eukprot:scaffold23542_cov242-Isochrysis_galbana.AAC.6
MKRCCGEGRGGSPPSASRTGPPPRSARGGRRPSDRGQGGGWLGRRGRGPRLRDARRRLGSPRGVPGRQRPGTGEERGPRPRRRRGPPGRGRQSRRRACGGVPASESQ